MFSLPRDIVDVPLPPGPRATPWGRRLRQKINSLLHGHPEPLRPRRPATSRTRGYNALKPILGNLYGLDIKYFVEVNFDGFKKVVDALGGVTINVQVPVLDDQLPGDTGRPRPASTSRPASST